MYNNDNLIVHIKKRFLLKMNLLYTIVTVTTFYSTQIHAMYDPILPFQAQQLYSPKLTYNTTANKISNQSIPLKTFSTNNFNATTRNNTAALKEKQEEEEEIADIIIPLNDCPNADRHNIPNSNQQIPEIETTTQQDDITAIRGGEMICALGGCAGTIGLIIYLAVLASGH
jgi:hypothetical protein